MVDRRHSLGGWSFKSFGGGGSGGGGAGLGGASSHSGSHRGSVFDLLFLLRRGSSIFFRNRRATKGRVMDGAALLEDELGTGERSAFLTTEGGGEERQPVSRDEIIRRIQEKREAIETLRCQPWNMHRKLRTLKYRHRVYSTSTCSHSAGDHAYRLAQRFLERHESTVSKTQLYKEEAAKRWKKFKRWCTNVSVYIIPWEARIKRIESHFGSVVSSYFTFLRWIFWINLIMSILMIVFIVVPESLADLGASESRKAHLSSRKEVPPSERINSTKLQFIWEFEGPVQASLLFYGFYGDYDTIGHFHYQLPLSYFLTFLAVLGYSFFAILRKMAANARLSKMSSGRAEQYTFSWKLFTLWDYSIGNPETATNTVAANSNKIRETITEYKTKQKTEFQWLQLLLRIIANIIIFSMIAASTFLVYTVVEKSKKLDDSASGWEKNEVPIVVSVITLFFPNIFELVGRMEKYHPRTALRLQLGRVLLLYLLNFYTLIFALFTKMKELADAQQTDQRYSDRNTKPPEFYLSDLSDGQIGAASIVLQRALRSLDFPSASSVAFLERMREDGIANASYLFDQLKLYQAGNYSSAALNASQFMAMPTVSIPIIHLLRRYLKLNETTFSTVQDNLRDYKILSEESFEASDVSSADLRLATKLSWTTYVPNLGAIGVDQAHAFINKHGSFDDDDEVYDEWTGSSVDQRKYTRSVLDYFAESESSDHPPFPVMFSKEGRVLRRRTTTTTTTTARPVASTSRSRAGGATQPTILRRRFRTTTPSPGTTKTETLRTKGAQYAYTVVPPDKGRRTSAAKLQQLQSTQKPFTRPKIACWETYMGQEICRLITMDLVITIAAIFVIDFFRGLIVRFCNSWCLWNLETSFPEYGEFKVAECVLHIVNNQGMIWLGLFFSPVLPAVNNIKLILIMYLRSWAVTVCNVPAQQVFRASRSNNFYLILLLLMLLLCTLPVGYVIATRRPSKACGPFTQYDYFYEIITEKIRRNVPRTMYDGLGYVASPGIIIPFLVLLILVIYFLASLVRALKVSNEDLRKQLVQERTEEKRKIYALAGGGAPNNKVKKIGKAGDKEEPSANALGSTAALLLPQTKKVNRSHLPRRELKKLNGWHTKLLASDEAEEENGEMPSTLIAKAKTRKVSLDETPRSSKGSSGDASPAPMAAPKTSSISDLAKLSFASTAMQTSTVQFIPSLVSLPEESTDEAGTTSDEAGTLIRKHAEHRAKPTKPQAKQFKSSFINQALSAFEEDSPDMVTHQRQPIKPNFIAAMERQVQSARAPGEQSKPTGSNRGLALANELSALGGVGERKIQSARAPTVPLASAENSRIGSSYDVTPTSTFSFPSYNANVLLSPLLSPTASPRTPDELSNQFGLSRFLPFERREKQYFPEVIRNAHYRPTEAPLTVDHHISSTDQTVSNPLMSSSYYENMSSPGAQPNAPVLEVQPYIHHTRSKKLPATSIPNQMKTENANKILPARFSGKPDISDFPPFQRQKNLLRYIPYQNDINADKSKSRSTKELRDKLDILRAMVEIGRQSMPTTPIASPLGTRRYVPPASGSILTSPYQTRSLPPVRKHRTLPPSHNTETNRLPLLWTTGLPKPTVLQQFRFPPPNAHAKASPASKPIFPATTNVRNKVMSLEEELRQVFASNRAQQMAPESFIAVSNDTRQRTDVENQHRQSNEIFVSSSLPRQSRDRKQTFRRQATDPDSSSQERKTRYKITVSPSSSTEIPPAGRSPEAGRAFIIRTRLLDQKVASDSGAGNSAFSEHRTQAASSSVGRAQKPYDLPTQRDARSSASPSSSSPEDSAIPASSSSRAKLQRQSRIGR